MKTRVQMVEHLKAIGLSQPLRAKCMETFNDAGEAEALEQAERYLTVERNQIAAAKGAARDLCGLNI